MLLFAAASVPVFAQSEEEEELPPIEYKLNREGDKVIRIGLSPSFPLNFPNPGALFSSDRKMSIGGLGSLGYRYFITDDINLGVDVGFGFNVTIGSHVFNYVPVVGSVTWQPTVGNFEFPVSLGVGLSWHTYIGYTYFPGLILQPSAGVSYRVTSNWSLGADASLMVMPEFDFKNPANNKTCLMGLFTLVARCYL